MRRIHSHLACKAAPIVAALLSSSAACAQAEFSVQVGWTDGSQPQAVEFNSGSVESRPFEKRSNHFLGVRRNLALKSRQDFVIRWPGLAISLRGRPIVRSGPSDPEFFRLTKPSTQMLCNDGDVRKLANRASMSDRDSRLSTMLQIMTLLQREGTRCTPNNASYLANLMFSLNYKIATQGEGLILDISPDVESLFRIYNRNKSTASGKIDNYKSEIGGLALKLAWEELTRLKEAREFDHFDDLISGLLDASNDSEFRSAFARQGIRVVDIRHRQLEVLFSRFEDRPRTSQIVGEVSEVDRTRADEALHAAVRLRNLSSDRSYHQAFANAGLDKAFVEALPATAQRTVDEIGARLSELRDPAISVPLTDGADGPDPERPDARELTEDRTDVSGTGPDDPI